MVQPFSYLEFDCGKTFKDFDEEKLLKMLIKLNLMIFKEHIGNHH